VAAAAVEASIAPLLPVPAAAVEEGETATEAPASRATLVAPTKVGPSGEDAVVVLDEDSVAPIVGEPKCHDSPGLGAGSGGDDGEPSPYRRGAGALPGGGSFGSSPDLEVAETSSARGVLTAEEVMELVTCRYIDFLGVGVIDLEAPQLLEKVYVVASEWMFNEPTIMETIASVSKVLQEYERTGGFTPAVVVDAVDAGLMAPAAHVEPTADAPAPPSVNERREA
jgi:hypothetical protein